MKYLEEEHFALPDPTGDEAIFLQALRYGPGDVFPAVKMVGPQEEETDFQALRRPDRAYLVNFWATYCAPCREEMPELEKLSPALRKSGVEVVGISLDMGEQRARVPGFLAQLGITYPVFTTDETVFAQLFTGEQIFVPLSFVVDREGRIADVLTGWSEKSEARIRSLIER